MKASTIYNTIRPTASMPHILWLGGSPCAGKTTIAALLAEKYGLRLYRYDRQEMEHIRRSSPEQRPALTAFLAMSMDERWLLRSPDAMAENVIQSWTERFPLVLEDLRAIPQDKMVIAEGPGLFPECVYPYLAGPQQAMWLVPTDAVCRTCRTGRPLSSYNQTSDPAKALQKLVARDMLLAAYVKRRAEEFNLRYFEVDGSQPIAEVATIVETHFALTLSPNPSPPAGRGEVY